MVETVFRSIWLLANILLLLSLRDSSGLLGQALFLLRFGLWAVLVEELESLSCSVSVEDMLELGNCGRNFEAQVKYLLLALEANVLRPPWSMSI